ncbi:unnamed protein product [Trichogramma brassicae]|uniref:Uncharacterized protein n=1 Tax=Trichogramma brassicae TaxID=86971 RepID=A0A6H5I3K0_9HYME|nr:unnamed protein product [Trichogramma brassicae]
MSVDEYIPLVKKQRIGHYDSDPVFCYPSRNSTEFKMPGNIYTLDQYFELEESMSNYRQTRQELERKKKAKEIILPKDDSEVKEILWRLEQPTSLFAEGPDAMRHHLRKLMSCSGRTDAFKKKVNERLKQIQENLDKIWSNEHPDSLRLVLLKAFFQNIASNEATIRRSAANMIVAMCVNCRKPPKFFNFVVEHLLAREDALTRRAMQYTEHHVVTSIHAPIGPSHSVQHRLLVDSLMPTFAALFQRPVDVSREHMVEIDEALSRILNVLVERLLIHSSKQSSYGYCEALYTLSETYLTSIYHRAWDCHPIPSSSKSNLANNLSSPTAQSPKRKLMEGSSKSTKSSEKSSSESQHQSRPIFRFNSKDQLGSLTGQSHYYRLYELLRTAHSNYRITLDQSASELYLGLLNACLRALAQVLEVATVVESNRVVEEILHYLQSAMMLLPTATIQCVRQLLKSLFGTNLVARWFEIRESRKLINTKLAWDDDDDIERDTGFYEQCFQRPAKVMNERIKEIDSNSKNCNEPDVAYR